METINSKTIADILRGIYKDILIESYIDVAEYYLGEANIYPVISKGNIKLGKIPGFSIMPIVTCRNNQYCKAKCYAKKDLRYNNSIIAKSKNTILAYNNPGKIYDALFAYLTKKKPKYFRWFSSGDIPTIDFFDLMISLANNCPFTKFLCYTKVIDLVYKDQIIPQNLIIRISTFEGMKHFEIAYYKSLEFRIAHAGTNNVYNYYICPGSCENCKFCWNSNNNVFFKFH